MHRSMRRSGTIPQVLDRIADQFSDHDALVTATDRSRLTFAAVARRGPAGRRGDDRPGRRRRGPGRDLVAEHLALGGRVPGHAPTPAACSCRSTPATPPARPADILARTGAPLLFASGEFLGADKAASIDRDALPDLRHIVRVPIEKDDGTWDEFVARGGRLEPRRRRRSRRGGHSPTTSPTSCSPPAPPAAARARCARTGSRSARLGGVGRVRRRSPATTATCASTRSSTTSATRPASWPACRPGRR